MSEQIRRDLAEIVRAELKDPRIGLCSFTEVKLSRDISHAVVYCSVFDESAQQETIDLLNHASGFLRSQLAHAMKLRVTPQLHFIYDASVERGTRLSQLIDQAVASDHNLDKN